jgi:hypothetical protein
MGRRPLGEDRWAGAVEESRMLAESWLLVLMGVSPLIIWRVEEGVLKRLGRPDSDCMPEYMEPA